MTKKDRCDIKKRMNEHRVKKGAFQIITVETLYLITLLPLN